MILNVLNSGIAFDPSYVPPGDFTKFVPNQNDYTSFDSTRIDWSNVKSVIKDGVPATMLYYEDQPGIRNPYFLLSSVNTIANSAGATVPGVTSYAPNIFVSANESLGHNWNIQTNSSDGGGYSNGFASYNQTLTGAGVNIVPSSWSIDIIQPLVGCSISLGTGAHAPGPVLAPYTFVTGSVPGLFIFQVNATSVDGLTTNQIFIWNTFT